MSFSTLFLPPGLGGLGIGKSPLPGILGDGDGGKAEIPQPQQAPLPGAPKVEDSVVKAETMANRRRAAMASDSKSVFTSPLGVAGQANVVRKTLLGQ